MKAWAPDGKTVVPLRCGGVVRDTKAEASFTPERRAKMRENGIKNAARAWAKRRERAAMKSDASQADRP